MAKLNFFDSLSKQALRGLTIAASTVAVVGLLKHDYDHNHRLIDGVIWHDHLIGKYLSEDQSFDPVHDEGTHYGVFFYLNLVLGCLCDINMSMNMNMGVMI